MQPVDDLVRLREPCERGRIAGRRRHGPQSELTTLLRRVRPVRSDPAAAHKQHIARLDVAALSGRADVHALRLADLRQEVKTHFVARIRIVDDAVGLAVGPDVEEDAAARNAVLRPVMNAAFQVRVGTNNVPFLGVVIKRLGARVRKMAESVPLRARLP